MQDDQQQFDALCFLHACGKTDQAEAAWMDAMMARHPHWRARFEHERLLVTQARAAESERQLAAPPLVSFEQVLAALADGEASAPTQRPVPVDAQPAAQGLLGRLQGRLQAWWRRPLAGGLAYGVMAVLVAGVSVQSWRLAQVGAPDVEAARYRGQAGATAGAAATAQLKVVFDDRASAGAIRLALHRLGLNIVHGPDAQGAYLLSAGHGDAAQAAQQLQATGLVLDALPLPASQAQSPQ